jgi:hypothetical protein
MTRLTAGTSASGKDLPILVLARHRYDRAAGAHPLMATFRNFLTAPVSSFHSSAGVFINR